MSKSDEKSKCIIIVIEIWRCENFSFAVHRYSLSEHDSMSTGGVYAGAEGALTGMWALFPARTWGLKSTGFAISVYLTTP